MANLEQQLAAHSIIGLDTSIFIYHFEAHPDYLPLTRRILKEVESGRRQAVTSTVTLMELTVLPWRINRPDIARQYEILLTNFPNLQIIEVSREVARRAAQLRAEFNIRPADALQVGTAFTNEATVWVSNDKKLRRLASIVDVVILDDFIEGELRGST